MPIDSADALGTLLAQYGSATPLPANTVTANLQLMRVRRAKLGAALDYININQKKLTGAFRPRTIRQVLTLLGNKIKSIDAQLLMLDQLRLAEENNAAKSIMALDDGVYAGNGKCYISFVNVGLGDCTLIATPTGSRIMIDCGSDSMEDVLSGAADAVKLKAIRDTINGPLFLNGSKQIHMLLLTHPDSDHHNRLKDVLSPLGVSIGIVYFGGTKNASSYAPTSKYLAACGGPRKKVDLCPNDTGTAVIAKVDDNLLPNAGTPKSFTTPFLAGANGPIVLYYEDDFRVSILASNVTQVWKAGTAFKDDSKLKTDSEAKLNGTEPNKRSLLILVEAFNRSVVICGDATVVTEQFAIDNFPAQLNDVEVVRMGHHGSPTSSSRAFLDAMPLMDEAIASTSGIKTRLHKLPKRAVLDEYMKRIPPSAEVKAHTTYAWNAETDGNAQPYYQSIQNAVFTTGCIDTHVITFGPPESES